MPRPGIPGLNVCKSGVVQLDSSGFDSFASAIWLGHQSLHSPHHAGELVERAFVFQFRCSCRTHAY